MSLTFHLLSAVGMQRIKVDLENKAFPSLMPPSIPVSCIWPSCKQWRLKKFLMLGQALKILVALAKNGLTREEPHSDFSRHWNILPTKEAGIELHKL